MFATVHGKLLKNLKKNVDEDQKPQVQKSGWS